MKLGFISEKVGPLPVWGWVAIGAAAYFFILRPHLASAASSMQSPSYVQVPTAQSGGGTTPTSPQPIDLSPLQAALTQLGTQLQTGFSGLSGQIAGLQTTTGPVNTPNPIPGTNPNPQAATYPAGFSFYQPSAQAKLPQLTYIGSTPAPGLTPATINADLVQRWTAAGLTPQQIAERAGLTPGAHSSLTGY